MSAGDWLVALSVFVAIVSLIVSAFSYGQAKSMAESNRTMANANTSMADSNKTMAVAANAAVDAALAGNEIALASIDAAHEANQIANAAILRSDESNAISKQTLTLLLEEAGDKKMARIRLVDPGISTSRDSVGIQFGLHNFGKGTAFDATATIVLGDHAFVSGDSGDIAPEATRKWYGASISRSIWNSYEQSFFHVAVRFGDGFGKHDLCIAIGIMDKGGSGENVFVTTDQTTGRRTPSMTDCAWKELKPQKKAPLLL